MNRRSFLGAAAATLPRFLLVGPVVWCLAMLVAMPLAAQTRISKPATADSLWLAMLMCSGATVQPGGGLADVKWRADPERLRAHHARAEWVPPDTILLAPDLALWEIAHELLHHVERGPPDNPSLGPARHPFNPFYFPCEVMPLQHPAVRP